MNIYFAQGDASLNFQAIFAALRTNGFFGHVSRLLLKCEKTLIVLDIFPLLAENAQKQVKL
jgi:hypothetical protein